MTTIYKQWLTCLLVLLIAACDVGSERDVASGGPGTGTGGTGIGIGGTGIAVISGFSSVILNNDRIFDVDVNTQLFIDDDPVTDAQLQEQGLGMVVRYDVAEDVSNSISSGTLVNLRAGYNVVGPVTSIAPLQVLGQTVVHTGDTVLVDLPNGNINNLELNDVLEVSGFDNDNNIILATRVQRQQAGVVEWKILGRVSDVNTGSFMMGIQQISLNGVIPKECGAGLAIGDSVEVKATPSPAFTSGNTLSTVIDVKCINVALNLPVDAVDNIIEAEVEGFVTGFTSINDFNVHGQRIVTTPKTVFEGGGVLDVVLGVRLEVEGVLDISTGLLSAERIRFRQMRIEIEAPLNVPSGGLGGSFTILDVITVNVTALTEDLDGLINGSGDSGLLQVEIEGYLDSSNQIFADSIELESSVADPNEIELRGPVSSPANPVFELLGITVDTTSSVIFDKDGNQISPMEFFDEVTLGLPVEVEDAVFTPGSPPMLSGGTIEVED